jgi:hypothetical protein
MKSKSGEIVKGAVFNSLTLTGNFSFIVTKEGRRLVVEAICKCGKIKNYPYRYLVSGNTKSCGCVRREKILASKVTHALSGHPLYSVYQDMKRRCYDKKNGSYKNYGGRGIFVCDEWLNDVNAFVKWGMDNGYEKGLELDRKGNDSNYEPSNCRFITRDIGNRNTRRNIYITAFGETKTVSEWARDSRCSITENALGTRFKSGKWTIQDAITFPGKSKMKELFRKSKSAKIINAFGEDKSLIEWSEDKRCSVSYSAVKNRLKLGWNNEKAISHPAKK